VIRRIVRGTGKTLISLGVLILLFVVFQLWGTGLTHDRAQKSLRSEFARQLAAPAAAEPAPTGAPATVPAPLVEGGPAGAIQIPKIGLDGIVVEGVGVEDLKKGVGHYPDTKMPGESGNAALAGHRTTYGHPFNRLDELEPSDEITVTTTAGTFRYLVTEKKVVTPETVEVLDPTTDNRLTLTTCHPKYSAEQRLIVVAQLSAPPQPPRRPARASWPPDRGGPGCRAPAPQTVRPSHGASWPAACGSPPGPSAAGPAAGGRPTSSAHRSSSCSCSSSLRTSPASSPPTCNQADRRLRPLVDPARQNGPDEPDDRAGEQRCCSKCHT
jgi:sortase A